MFLKMQTDRSLACANGAPVASRTDSFSSLISNAFLVMFDERSDVARKRQESRKRRDIDFDRFVSQHGPFTRYMP